MSTSASSNPKLPRRSVQAGYCDNINDEQCVHERAECIDPSSFRSSREMQGAPERAHGGVCLLTESTLGKPLGICADGTKSNSGSVCSPNKESCVSNDIFIAASKSNEKNESGCVVEGSSFGRCGEDRCAWSSDDCQEGESWNFPDMDCSCDKVRVGGCQKTDGTDDKVYCAVSSDACDSKSTFLSSFEVERAAGYQCFLCREFAEEYAEINPIISSADEDSDSKDSYSNSADDDVTTLIAKIDKYPEANMSGRPPKGSVSMTFYSNDDITMELNANYLSSGCTGSSTTKNGCGVQIHAGKSCDDPSFVEGRYYDSNIFAKDPWIDVRYSSSVDGLSTSRTIDGSTNRHIVMLKGNGYDAADNLGRAVVVYDSDGGRVGCGLLQYKDSSTLVASSTTSTTSSNTYLLIGGGIGGAVGAAFVLLFTALLSYQIKRNGKETAEVKKPRNLPSNLVFEEKSASTKEDEMEDMEIL